MVTSLVLEAPKKTAEMGYPKCLRPRTGYKRKEGGDQCATLKLLSPALEKVPKKQVTARARDQN